MWRTTHALARIQQVKIELCILLAEINRSGIGQEEAFQMMDVLHTAPLDPSMSLSPSLSVCVCLYLPPPTHTNHHHQQHYHHPLTQHLKPRIYYKHLGLR